YDTGTSDPINVHGTTPPAQPGGKPGGPQGLMPGQQGGGQKAAGPLGVIPGMPGAAPLPGMQGSSQPGSDVHNLPGLATPGKDSQQPGQGLPASPGIGIGGGIIGAAEGAAESAASMAVNAAAPGAGQGASQAMGIIFQEINRAASYGAQAAG